MRQTSALQWRVATLADLDAIDALHRLSIRGLGPEVVKAEQKDFFGSLIEGRGLVTTLWDDTTLAAYGVLQHDLLPEDDPREALGLHASAPVRKLAGAAVDPAWRGLGLQRELAEHRLRLAGPLVAVFATSAPGNPASWRSLLACGLQVHALERRYGGLVRYLMARVPAELDARDEDAPTQDAEIDVADLPAQQALLDDHWRGIAIAAGGTRLRYRRHGRPVARPAKSPIA